MINTLDKFLTATKFSRHTNHPTPKVLKVKMSELKVNKDLKIDIMSFFLYDNNSK